jgi:hypothetical protein
LQLGVVSRFLCNEKVGLRPLVCFAKCWYYTTVLNFLIYAGRGGKDKPPYSRPDRLKDLRKGEMWAEDAR